MAYQKDNRDVQSKGDGGIEEQSEDAHIVDIAHTHLGHFHEQSDDSVDRSTGRCVVVERDQWVHLELGRRENTLHHDESDRLEDNASHLN